MILFKSTEETGCISGAPLTELEKNANGYWVGKLDVAKPTKLAEEKMAKQ